MTPSFPFDAEKDGGPLIGLSPPELRASSLHCEMPALICGLDSFVLPAQADVSSVAKEFAAAFHPSLPEAATAAIEVYRLEPVPHDASLAEDDLVLCRVPAWSFDLGALEVLHQQVEDLQVQYARTQEALVALSSAAAASSTEEESIEPISPSSIPRDGDPYQEIARLRRQLAVSERCQQETKASVMALRQEYMHLVEAHLSEMVAPDALHADAFGAEAVHRSVGSGGHEGDFGYDVHGEKERTGRFTSLPPPLPPTARRFVAGGSPRSFASPTSGGHGYDGGSHGRHVSRFGALSSGPGPRARSAGRRSARPGPPLQGHRRTVS